jgi:hypothetical protein
MAFTDVASLLLPDVGRFDRGYALERALEAASRLDGSRSLAVGFLELFGREGERNDRWRPALLLNATHQSTGRRLIASHFRTEEGLFLDAWDLFDVLKSDVPASTAIHNSARFSYVSPAGRLIAQATTGRGTDKRYGFVLDGGYFENYGAVTALQLIRRVAESGNAVRPVLILISSNLALPEEDHGRILGDYEKFCDGKKEALPHPEELNAPNAFFNELKAPAAGLLASREAHGTLAAKELGRYVCNWKPSAPPEVRRAEPQGEATAASATSSQKAVFVHFAMCEKGGSPPLGWVLSSASRASIVKLIDDEEDLCGNKKEMEALLRAFGKR